MGGVLGKPSEPERAAMPRLVCIEGNIAAGKSTCLAELRARGYTVYTEPIDTEWAPLFTLRKHDPARWSFAFQIQVLCTLERQRHTARTSIGPFKGDVIFFERSPKACLAFSRLAYAKGFVTDTELALLAEMCAFVDSGADAYVYLNSSDPECHKRMQERSRAEEAGITLHDLALTRQAMEAERLHALSVDADGSVDASVENVLRALGISA